MRRWLILMIGLFAAPAGAQAIRGAVLDSVAGRPIAGAVVMLIDGHGQTLGRTLTNQFGQYRLAQNSGAVRLRLQRLGFRMKEVPAPPPSDTDAFLDARMTELASLLEPVRVVVSPKCPARSDNSAAFALLLQAQAGLLTTIVAREAKPAKMVRLSFERLPDSRPENAWPKVHLDSVVEATVSFKAIRSGSELVREGFRWDSAGRNLYLGPDADALLDDGFLAGYCFRIMAPDPQRENQIGLGFTAAEHKRNHVDIDGALWIDTVSVRLVNVEFRYIGAGDEGKLLPPGGRTSFHEMPNGVVILDSWMLRLPSGRRGALPMEGGGVVARASWPDGLTWQAPLGTLRLRAWHRDGTPGTGLQVQIANTDYRATTDSEGRAEIRDLLPGTYAVGFAEPQLADYGFRPKPQLTVTTAGSVVDQAVTINTFAEEVIALCKAEGDWRPDGMVVLGDVLSERGTPLAGADVGLEVARRPLSYKSDNAGRFLFCLDAMAQGASIDLSARRDALSSMTVTHILSKQITLIHLVLDQHEKQ